VTPRLAAPRLTLGGIRPRTMSDYFAGSLQTTGEGGGSLSGLGSGGLQRSGPTPLGRQPLRLGRRCRSLARRPGQVETRVEVPPPAGPALLIHVASYRVARPTEVSSGKTMVGAIRPTRVSWAILLTGSGLRVWTGGLRQQGRELLACGQLRPYTISWRCPGLSCLAARCRLAQPRRRAGGRRCSCRLGERLELELVLL
jgi:hypothetical protein